MLSLATRLRPSSFKDIIGQDFTIRVLTHALKNKSLSQVLLFSGGPGVGKTTLARIVALYVVCEQSSACLECPNCKALLNQNHPDVIEFDAATNTGVDDIRSVLESANYRPQLAKGRVFIIDETHMLSKSATSALLKIIEDTPENVWFFFATTELDKIPFTIISRALLFKLENIKEEEMINFLEKVCKQHQVKCQENVLSLVSKYANGCVRAALSTLEQIMLIDESELTYDSALKATKFISKEDLEELYDAINSYDQNKIFELTENFVQKANPYFIAQQLLEFAELKRDMAVGLQMAYAMEELAYSPCPDKLLGMLLAKACMINSMPSAEKLWQAVKKENVALENNHTEENFNKEQLNMKSNQGSNSEKNTKAHEQLDQMQNESKKTNPDINQNHEQAQAIIKRAKQLFGV